jgi:hypothetical protein
MGMIRNDLEWTEYNRISQACKHQADASPWLLSQSNLHGKLPSKHCKHRKPTI